MDIKTISRQELEKLYREKTNIELASDFGVSVPTLIRYITENNIALKQKGNHDNSDKRKIIIA